MRPFIFAICCTAATILAPACGLAQGVRYAAYEQRPEPPVEPSIPTTNASVATPQQCTAPRPVTPIRPANIVHRIAKVPAGPATMPPPEVLAMMLRSTFAAVNQANFTENYSVLRGMMTPALQTRLGANQLGVAFAGLRKQNLDLSPALVIAPQFAGAPALTPEGVLRLKGFFPSRPLQIDFAIDYRSVDGYWLVEALSVTTAQPSATAAPQAAVEPPARATSSTLVPTPERQIMRVPQQHAFWERRFVHETFLGPYLRFAENAW